jgi:O-antigen/teichoic acid export membrane protein
MSGHDTDSTGEMSQPRFRRFLLVGSGLAMIGLGSLALLAIAARALPSEEFASFGTWFAVVNLVAFGLFGPLETAVSRSMLTVGGLTAATKRQAATYACAVLATLLLVLAVFHSIAVPRLMSDSRAMVGVTLAYTAVLALQAFERGVAVGHSEYRPLFWQFASDGALRVVLPIAAVAIGAASPLTFALCVTAAALVGGLSGFLSIKSPPDPSVVRLPEGLSVHALAGLVVAALGAQLLMNGAPPILSVLDRDSPRTLAVIVGALTLTRIPLLFTSAIQAPLLPPMVGMMQRGDRDGLWRLLRRLLTVLLIVGVVAAGCGWFLGRAVLRAYLGTPELAEPFVLALLTCSGVLLLATLVVQAALIATTDHFTLVSAWVIGGCVFGVVILMGRPGPSTAPIAIVLGTLATLSAMLFGLRVGLRQHRPSIDPESPPDCVLT